MASEDKALANVGGMNDPEWKEIVDKIVNQLDNTDLPEQVVEATELLLAGWPTYKAAKKLGIQPKMIRTWLNTYSAMAMAVANGRKLLSKWRMAKLEQQFVQAMEKSEEILDLDLEDRAVNAKLVGTVAQHARFIISLFAGQKIDVNVKVEEGDQTLKAKEDALAFIADQLAKQRLGETPVEGVYRVVDVTPEEAKNRPLLDENGNPLYGQLGILDTNDEGTLCHACGERFKFVSIHIGSMHHLDVKNYEIIFMLPLGCIKELEKGKSDGEANSNGN